MKKILAITLALMLMLAAGCAAQPKDEPETPPEQTEDVGLANPWTEYDNLADAEEAAGFTFPQPKWDITYDKVSYRVTDGIIEIIYEQDDGHYMLLRKGADETDISGDYGDYHFTETQDGITVMGEADTADTEKLCKSASCVADGHFFYIWCDEPVPMDELIGTVKLITAQA